MVDKTDLLEHELSEAVSTLALLRAELKALVDEDKALAIRRSDIRKRILELENPYSCKIGEISTTASNVETLELRISIAKHPSAVFKLGCRTWGNWRVMKVTKDVIYLRNLESTNLRRYSLNRKNDTSGLEVDIEASVKVYKAWLLVK